MKRKISQESEERKSISLKAIKKGVLPQPDHQTKEVIEYAEVQLNKGSKRKTKITHLEKVKSEVVLGREYVVWDVHTDRAGRWWVITGLTNLYSQEEFPSLDYTLSFHVGLTARVISQDQKKAPESRQDRLRSAWRKWENAAETLEEAKEPEDFQSIGMICRECLIELVKYLQKTITIPEGQDRPKASDFLNWSDIAISQFALGERNKHIRSYLKTSSKETWQLVNWLTHTSSATLHEAEISIDATGNLLRMISLVVMKSEADAPESCPKCNSYRIVSVFEPDLDIDPPYVNLCEVCGWNTYNDPA